MTITDLVSIRKGESTRVSLSDLQDLLDARERIAEAHTPTSTRKSRVEQAKKDFATDSELTVIKIQDCARELAEVFDHTITQASVPLSQDQINTISEEFLRLEQLRIQIEGLETRYRDLIYGHLNEVGPKIPGRPAAQVPGKVEASGPGPHYVFERRGGNRSHPDLDTDGLRSVLSDELASQLYATVRHDPTPGWDEEVFDEGRLGELVDEGKIDLDTIAPFLTPGPWRTPSFYKTLMDGEK